MVIDTAYVMFDIVRTNYYKGEMPFRKSKSRESISLFAKISY